MINNLTKSANYVEVQARALLASGAPPVTRRQLYGLSSEKSDSDWCSARVGATEWLGFTKRFTGRFPTCVPRPDSGSSNAILDRSAVPRAGRNDVVDDGTNVRVRIGRVLRS